MKKTCCSCHEYKRCMVTFRCGEPGCKRYVSYITSADLTVTDDRIPLCAEHGNMRTFSVAWDADDGRVVLVDKSTGDDFSVAYYKEPT